MSEATNFYRDFQKQTVDIVVTSFPCKVLSYDESARECRVQPLYTENGEAFPVIEGARVLYQRYRGYRNDESRLVDHVPVYQTGDIVQVMFSKYPLDDALNGRTIDVTENKFRLIDAVVLGVF